MISSLDPISQAAYRQSLTFSLRSAFAKWDQMPSDRWAETVRRRPGLHGASVGMDLNYFPPQREMLAEIFNPKNQEVVFQLFSRAGKSETVLTAIGYCIDQAPRRFIVMWPTTGQAEKWSKDDFQEQLIEPTPQLAKVLGDSKGQRRASNTILFKRYPGGLLNIVGANSMGELRRAKGDFLYAEEIDAIEECEGDEGDQLAILEKRGSEYANTIFVLASYPSLKGQSRIQARLDLSDYRQWYVPCEVCGFDRWIMSRKDIQYDVDKPELARLQCPHKGCLIDDAGRYRQMRSGLWIATREYKGKAGFQANALLWPHEVSVNKYPGGFLQMLAQQEINADKSDNPERARRVIVNTVDAEPYEPKVEAKVKHSDIYLRREDYDPRQALPDGVLLITAGCDVQGDRLEVEVVGHGIDEQTWGIDYIVIPGNPLTPEPWEKLDKILERGKWKHPLYGYIGIHAMAIDCGFKPDEVVKFVRPRRRRRVFAVFGSTTLGKMFVGAPTKRGKPPVAAFELGTHEAKDVIYQRLEITDPKAHGFMHFPKIGVYDEKYFKGLTIEDSMMKRSRDGDFYRFFECPQGERNEPLDTRVYAIALPRILRTNFRKLLDSLKDKAKEATTAPDPERPNLAMPVKPAPQRQRGFVNGWR